MTRFNHSDFNFKTSFPSFRMNAIFLPLFLHVCRGCARSAQIPTLSSPSPHPPPSSNHLWKESTLNTEASTSSQRTSDRPLLRMKWRASITVPLRSSNTCFRFFYLFFASLQLISLLFLHVPIVLFSWGWDWWMFCSGSWAFYFFLFFLGGLRLFLLPPLAL